METEADQLAFDAMQQAGFDTAAMADVFETMAQLQGFYGSKDERLLLTYLSTHPPGATRLANINARLLAGTDGTPSANQQSRSKNQPCAKPAAGL